AREKQPIVTLTVRSGDKKDETREFSEPDTFLLSRYTQGSQADFWVSQEDTYVSRRHLLLEINPPECWLQDLQSLNGTFVVRSREQAVYFFRGTGQRSWSEVALRIGKPYGCRTVNDAAPRLKLESEDLIIVGLTIIEVAIRYQAISAEPETVRCIRCGTDMTADFRQVSAAQLHFRDFICAACLQQEKRAITPPVGTIRCWKCNYVELTQQAQADGRAAELDGVAFYLCNDCRETHYHREYSTQIGDYEILEELGVGGFGSVSLVRHLKTHRLAALKLLKAPLRRNDRLLKRFRREIAIMCQLQHPYIVRLYEDGVWEENYYFVSEYLHIGNLQAYCYHRYGGRMPYPRAVYFFCQAMIGLSYFHQHGFVHRDLKPDNIFLGSGKSGELIAKVGDFGFSKRYILQSASLFGAVEELTMPGEIGGVLEYSSPEQIEDFKHLQPISDVYSMGVSLYRIVTGEFPYDFLTNDERFELIKQGENPPSVISIIVSDVKPVPIEQRLDDIPAGLAQAINRSLAKNPQDRFQTIDEFQKAIEGYAS
ncbi:MAG: protein kinase, partial [bacterium]